MKRILILTLVLVSLSSIAFANTYQQVGEIIEFDTSSCYWYSIIYTQDGNTWAIDIEDEHAISDIVMVTFDDNNTADITDDVIIDVNYLFNAIDFEF